MTGEYVLTVGAKGEINRLLYSYAKQTGFKVTSFDIDPDLEPDILGDICEHDFGGEKYDAVVMLEVLEHCHSPHLALQTVFSCLRPGGLLILSAPFILPIHLAPFDYYRFTRHGLEFLLRDYEKVEITARNLWFDAIEVLNCRLFQSNNKLAASLQPLFIIITLIKHPFVVLLNRCMPTDSMTTGYVVLARKPTSSSD